MNKAVPRTTSSMPSVTRNDGILSRVTNRPLTRPIKAATASATMNAVSSDVTPLLNKVHINTGVKPKSEPTDRSNSPDVISSVIASAIKPNSTVKASVLLMFCGDRKSGFTVVNTTISTTRSTSGPNSDRAISRSMSARDFKGTPATGRGACTSGANRPRMRGSEGLFPRQDVVVSLRRVLLVEGAGDHVEAGRNAARCHAGERQADIGGRLRVL